MNLNPLNNSNNHDNIYYTSQNTSNLNYPEIVPKNLQYFPIASKGAVTGENMIYLAAEDNQTSNNYIPKNENEYPNKNNNQKKKEKNISIIPQRSFGIQIQKSKFEYLLNLPTKKENENNGNKILPIKKEGIKEEKKNKKYINLNSDFISEARILMHKKHAKKRKDLAHSYSMENYSNVLNKSLSLSNFTKLENSKIMDEKFINGMKDSRRKDNLVKAIEKYKRFTLLGKNNINNIGDSFTLRLGNDQNKYRQKSIEKMYRMKNNYNIIEEDENENSDNDTIKKKSGSTKLDDSINNTNEINNNGKDNNNNKNKEVEEEIKVIENADKSQKIKEKDKNKKLKLKKNIKIRDDDDYFGNSEYNNNINNKTEENKKIEKIKNNDNKMIIPNKDTNDVFYEDNYTKKDSMSDMKNCDGKKDYENKDKNLFSYLDIYKELNENIKTNYNKGNKNNIKLLKENKVFQNDIKDIDSNKKIEKIIYRNDCNNKNKNNENQNNYINVEYFENDILTNNKNKTNDNIESECIGKSIKNEISKICKTKHNKENSNLNININNNINNNISINNNINNNININNINSNNKNISTKNNNNINININNINKNKQKKNNNNNKSNKVLIRKLLREERYIIDENGKEKILEVNQTLLSNKSNNNGKQLVISEKNPNNIIINNSNVNNVGEEIIKKERYHRKNKKILITERKADSKDKYRNIYLNKINISPKINNDNNKIQYIIGSPNNKILYRTTNNSRNKDYTQKIKLSKINQPNVIKRLDTVLPNKILIYNSLNKNKNLFLNNNIKKVIYIPSPNNSTKKYNTSKTEQNKNMDSNNHSYYEIATVTARKNNGTSKTIYHDYSNLDKRLILNNSSKNMNEKNEKQTIFKIKDNYINRNYSVNNMKNPTSNGTKKIIIDNNGINGCITKDKNSKIKIKFLNENKYDNNYRVYDDINIKSISRSGTNTVNTHKVFNKCNLVEYNNNIKFLNSNSSRNNQIYERSFRKYSNEGQNSYLYQYNNSNEIMDKINPLNLYH